MPDCLSPYPSYITAPLHASIKNQKQAKQKSNNDESFNKELCQYLEYHLSATFRNSNKKSLEDYGVMELSDDQNEFQMKIKFGKYSLRRYAKGRKIIDFIPNTNSLNQIENNIEDQTIEIQQKQK